MYRGKWSWQRIYHGKLCFTSVLINTNIAHTCVCVCMFIYVYIYRQYSLDYKHIFLYLSNRDVSLSKSTQWKNWLWRWCDIDATLKRHWCESSILIVLKRIVTLESTIVVTIFMQSFVHNLLANMYSIFSSNSEALASEILENIFSVSYAKSYHTLMCYPSWEC